MSQNRKQEIVDLLFQLESRIRPLQWDFNRGQINPFKAKELERLSAERSSLQEELTGLDG